VARGDAFLSAGDFTSARGFFERAAHAGDSQAAMRMAVTFDAAFLDRVGLHGVRGDPKQAAFWYQRARDLSGAEPDQRSPEKAPSGAPSTH
jgi:TPR repeat protein